MGDYKLSEFWGFSSWHPSKSYGKVPRLNDLKVHEEQVHGGESVDSKPDVDDGVKDFPVFAGHIVSLGKNI